MNKNYSWTTAKILCFVTQNSAFVGKNFIYFDSWNKKKKLKIKMPRFKAKSVFYLWFIRTTAKILCFVTQNCAFVGKNFIYFDSRNKKIKNKNAKKKGLWVLWIFVARIRIWLLGKKYNLKFLTTYTFLNIYFSAFKGPVRSESNPSSGDPQDSQLFYESELNNKGISREA